jgi:hypothetical protein
MVIQFRDRPLKEGETSQYYCDICGEEVHPDFVQSHKCGVLLKFSLREGK